METFIFRRYYRDSAASSYPLLDRATVETFNLRRYYRDSAASSYPLLERATYEKPLGDADNGALLRTGAPMA